MYRQFFGETSDRRCEAKEVGEGKGRKRGVMEAVANVAEGGGKKVKEIVDVMGIETDEEAGVSVPAFES